MAQKLATTVIAEMQPAAIRAIKDSMLRTHNRADAQKISVTHNNHEHSVESVWGKIWCAITGIDAATWKKKTALTGIGYDIAHSGYRFYNPKSQKLTEEFAELLSDLYRFAYPLQILFGRSKNNPAFSSLVVECNLDPEQTLLLSRLSSEGLNERAMSCGIMQLQREVFVDIERLSASFSQEFRDKVNSTYIHLRAFIGFFNYDFWNLLRKFDPNYPERDAHYRPNFQQLNAHFIMGELLDFADVFDSLELKADWPKIIGIFLGFPDFGIVAAQNWTKMIPRLFSIQKSNIVDLIVRHAKAEPKWEHWDRRRIESVMEPYIESLKQRACEVLEIIAREKSEKLILESVEELFGNEYVQPLQNYNDGANAIFCHRCSYEYTLSKPFNYLFSFAIQKIKFEFQHLVEIFVVRAQWIEKSQSLRISDSYHSILDIIERIEYFDESLDRKHELGRRVQQHLFNAIQDPIVMKKLYLAFLEINNQARRILTDALSDLGAFLRILVALQEDSKKEKPEIIANWQRLFGPNKISVKEKLAESIANISQLIRILDHHLNISR